MLLQVVVLVASAGLEEMRCHWTGRSHNYKWLVPSVANPSFVCRVVKYTQNILTTSDFPEGLYGHSLWFVRERKGYGFWPWLFNSECESVVLCFLQPQRLDLAALSLAHVDTDHNSSSRTVPSDNTFIRTLCGILLWQLWMFCLWRFDI